MIGELPCHFVVFLEDEPRPRAAFERLEDARAWAAAHVGDHYRVERQRLATVTLDERKH